MGLSRSPIAKLFKPTPEQMEEPQMTEDMRSFAIQQQAIDTQLKNLQKQNVEQQNALAAEQAAQQYYQQPASARERFLEENQQALGASTGVGIYRGQMLQQRQATLSDKTLAPHIAKSIPIEVRGEYWNRVTAGQSPTEAKDAVEVMAYNRDLRSKLAEVMSPEEINKKYGSDAAPLDPAVITYEISQRKGASKGGTADVLKEYYNVATERLKPYVESDLGPPEEGDPRYASYQEALKEQADAWNSYRSALRKGGGFTEEEIQQAAPPPAGTDAVTPPAATGRAKAAVTQVPQIDIDAELSQIPATRQAAYLEGLKKKQAEQQTVAETWTKARNDLEEKLKKLYPDKPFEGTKIVPLEQLALQILSGKTVADEDPNAPTDEFGRTPEIPIQEEVLRQLGAARFGKAFTEPGSKRKSFFNLFGSQDVSYNEIIRDWARRFAESRGLINTPVSERADIAPEEREVGSKLMDKYVPATIN